MDILLFVLIVSLMTNLILGFTIRDLEGRIRNFQTWLSECEEMRGGRDFSSEFTVDTGPDVDGVVLGKTLRSFKGGEEVFLEGANHAEHRE